VLVVISRIHRLKLECEKPRLNRAKSKPNSAEKYLSIFPHPCMTDTILLLKSRRSKVLSLSILAIFFISMAPFALSSLAGSSYASKVIANTLSPIEHLISSGDSTSTTPAQQNAGVCMASDNNCGNVGYGGGPLMHNSTFNLIFWLPSGTNPVTGQPYTFDNTTIDPPPSYASPNLPKPSDTNYENLITRFFQDVAVQSSSLWNITLQYTDGQDNNLPPGPCFTVTVAGKSVCDVNTFVDTSPFPTNGGSVEGTPANPLQGSDISNEVGNVISSQGWTQAGGNNFFAVFTPYKVFQCSTTSFIIIELYSGCTFGIQANGTTGAPNGFCAWHNYYPQTLNIGQQPTIYAFVADEGSIPSSQPVNKFTGSSGSCLPWGSYGNNGGNAGMGPNGDPFADAAINTASHELFESATDPQPGRIGTGGIVSNGWIFGNLPNGASHEIGDMCDFNFGENSTGTAPINPDGSNVILNGDPYLVQTEWSNSNGGCTLDTSGLPIHVPITLFPDKSSNQSPSPFTVYYAEEGSFPTLMLGRFPQDASTNTTRNVGGNDVTSIFVRQNSEIRVEPVQQTTEQWAFESNLGDVITNNIPPTSQTFTLSMYYYDLLAQTVSYSIIGGGTPTPPNLNYTTASEFPVATDSPYKTQIALSTTPTTVWVLRGSSASVPAVLPSSTKNQQWLNSGATSWNKITKANRITNPIVYNNQYKVQFAPFPSSDGSVTPASGFFNAGSTVPITATPASSLYQFIDWTTQTGQVSVASTSSASTTATINGPDNVTGVFAHKLVFIQDGLPAKTAWSVTVNGVGTFTNTTNSQGLGTIVMNALTPGGYSWSVGTPIEGKSGTQYVASQSANSLNYPYQTEQMIVFTKQYLVLFTTNPSSAGSTTPSSNTFGAWYSAGSEIPISAAPYTYSNYAFSSWKANTTSIKIQSSTSQSTNATLNGPGMITANFKHPTNTISVTEVGLPTGTSWSATLSNSTNTLTQTGTTNVLKFTGIIYGSYTLSVSSNIAGSPGVHYVTTEYYSMSVPFQTSAVIIYQTQYSVSFASNPSSEGYTLPTTSSEFFNAGSTVAITAVPYTSSGYAFGSWSSSTTSIPLASSTAPATTMVVNGPGTVTANFNKNTSNPCSLCTATFTEVGLPSGTTWGVNFNGVGYFSSTSTISIPNVPAGSDYSWSSFGPIAGSAGVEYTTSQTSGTFYVPEQISQVIVYATEYQITFSSSNPSFGTTTPSQTTWYPAGSMISITASPNNPAGSYSFNKWSSSTTSIKIFKASAAATNATINGPGTITGTFDQDTYTTTFTEVGLPSGTTWSITFNGQLYFSSTSTIKITGVIPSGSNYWTSTDQIGGSSSGVRYTSTLQSGSSQTGYLYVPQQTSQVIVYTEQFDITYAVSPTSSGYTSPYSSTGNWYNVGTVVPITSTVYNYNQYAFSSWSASSGSIKIFGSGDSSTALTFDGTGTVTANFIQAPFG
jgi:hypothetical protein